jgi:SAM-dependent methyltransferase
MKSLGMEFDIIKSEFNGEFEFNFKKENKEKYDLILFSHSLYGIEDPHGAVIHATKFLKPGGKMLIIIAGESIESDLQRLLESKSDPNVFSASKAIQDNTLTAEKILFQLQEGSSELSLSVMKEQAYEEVDDYVRRKDVPGCDDTISFFLQVEHSSLSEETKQQMYQMVVDQCTLVDGKYSLVLINHGIIVSVASRSEFDI